MPPELHTATVIKYLPRRNITHTRRLIGDAVAQSIDHAAFCKKILGSILARTALLFDWPM